MSVDDRIRAGMQANATSFQPEVESGLDKVRAGRRGQAVARAGVVTLVAAAAAVAAVAVLAWPRTPEQPSPAGPPPAQFTSELFGRYVSQVSSPERLAGRWVLEFDGNGTVAITPPNGYAGVVSGTLFTADATTLRINLFTQDLCANLGIGEYWWTRQDDRLLLGPEAEPCVPRRGFFTDNDWVASP